MSDARPGIPEDLPALDRPLGSIDHELGNHLTGDERFHAAGRLAHGVGTAADGVREIWLDPYLVARGLRVRCPPDGADPDRVDPDAAGLDLRVRSSVETPLGVERRLGGANAEWVERLVVSRDVPAVWWEIEPTGDGRDRWPILELQWTLAPEWTVAPRPKGRPPGRLVLATRADSPFRALFLLGAEPESLDVRIDDAGGTRMRARVAVPSDGFRIAVVGAGPDDDLDRLLRIAGRTRVAVGARAGAVSRTLADGLAIETPDPAGDADLARALVRLDATTTATRPGGWRIRPSVRESLARLAVGDTEGVRSYLHALARGVDAEGRVPGAGAGGRPTSYDDPEAGLLLLLLAGRYLAWSGDRAGVVEIWPALMRAFEAWSAGRPAARDGEHPLRALALESLAVAAEDVGEGEAAVAVRAAAGDPTGDAAPSDVPAADDPAGLILDRLGALMGPEPDAVRGRITLRPRPPGGWDRYEVRNLVVGEAGLDLSYARTGPTHRFRIRPTRGPAPLQLVLAPELQGGTIAAIHVDRTPAELDVETLGDRRRVPVQLVLDQPRVVEVSFAGDFV